MPKSIFRQAALDRLASPDQLDEPVRLVGPLAWLAVTIILAAVALTLVWSITVRVPVKVASQGILIETGGLLEITSSEPGRIARLLLGPGQSVRSGDLVAEIAQPDLRRQLDNAEAKLISARDRFERLGSFYAQSRKREKDADGARLDTIGQTAERLRERVKLLERKRVNVEKLVRRKALAQDRLLAAEVDLSDARERLAELDDEASLIGLRRLDREAERDLELLDQRLQVEELEREHARIARMLEDREHLRSPYSGKVVEVRVNAGEVLQAGTPLATLQSAAGASSANQVLGLLYIPPADGKQVQAGMTVEVSPTTVRREEFGFMLGEVATISPLPATVEGMKRQLQNDQLVKQLSGSGAPFEATVRLRRDADTPSGFAWSSSAGPTLDINAGTLFEGKVIVRRVRLASLLIPEIEKYFPAQ